MVIQSCDDKNFIGIGKMLIDTLDEAWNIPNLHFLVKVCADGVYEAVCLEFGLVSSGDSRDDAIKNLGNHTMFYISVVLTKGNGYDEFIEIAKSHFMDDLWAVYRSAEFKKETVRNYVRLSY